MRNSEGRQMGEKQWEDNKIKKADLIFEKFEEFSTGYRCLFLIQRHKEGGETNNSKLVKKITRNSEEYKQALRELISEQMESELTLRVYASVNDRNFNKAIRKFKFEQLEADYYDQKQKENFYLDVRNRFIGCLMQPTQKDSSLFLFDIDNQPGRDVQGEALKAIPNQHIVKMYATKNGWHIVTIPFNHTTLTLPANVELNTDGLLLLSY